MPFKYADPLRKPPLDDQLYSLPPDALAYFKSQTGIQDENVLREHIIAVQRKAYEYYGYPCIRSFTFTRSEIARYPVYKDVLKLRDQRPDAIFLDIGCCFGNDIRKVVGDGWDVQKVIASDIQEGFWKCGHELFKSTPQTFPVIFVPGDVLQPEFIEPRAPFYEKPENNHPPLNSLTRSLTPMQGHISVIQASALFHVFSEDEQLEVARRLASLLSPMKGSVIFGSQMGLREKGWRLGDEDDDGDDDKVFCHSPESWEELWDGRVFEKGAVEVVADLYEVDVPLTGKLLFMSWSVTRT